MARRIAAKLLHVPVTALKDELRDGTALAAALTDVLENQPSPLTVLPGRPGSGTDGDGDGQADGALAERPARATA